MFFIFLGWWHHKYGNRHLKTSIEDLNVKKKKDTWYSPTTKSFSKPKVKQTPFSVIYWGDGTYLWNAPPGLQRWPSSSSSRTDCHGAVDGRSHLWRSYPAASHLCLRGEHCREVIDNSHLQETWKVKVKTILIKWVLLCKTHDITCPTYAILTWKHELWNRNVRLTVAVRVWCNSVSKNIC